MLDPRVSAWWHVVTSEQHSLLNFLDNAAEPAKSRPPEWILNLVIFGLPLLLVLGSVLVTRKLMKGVDTPLAPGEQLERDLPANRWTGLVSAGGSLRITNQRLLFVPHALNFGDKKPLSLPWHEITRVGYGGAGKELVTQAAAELAGGSASSTLVVEHINGADRFAVHESPQLIASIEAHLQRVRAERAG